MIIYGHVCTEIASSEKLWGNATDLKLSDTLTKIVKHALIWPILKYYGQQCSRMVHYD